jgi:glycosyltransferase involved in cell wall biosynthesis
MSVLDDISSKDRRPVNIMLLVSSMGSGGAERVAATLANAWVQRGDCVSLIATFSGRGKCFYPLSSAVRFIYLADLAGVAGHGTRADIRRLMALRSLVRDGAPDVVISFLTNVNVTAILATLGLRVPVIACEHNDPSADGRSRFWRMLCRLAYPRAAHVTVLTANALHPLRKMVPGLKRISVMPNPVPDEVFRQPRAPRPDRRKRLISVGRLNPQKQFDILINAFACVAGDFDEWDLWIFGEGPERPALQARIERLQMSTRVRLMGLTAKPWEEMANADAFAMTSRFEGLPMALMESMAIGLPVAAFDCRSGPRELTQDGKNGLLVPPDNPRAMTAALRRLLEDDALRADLGARAADSIRQRYSVDAVLRAWDALFDSVIVTPQGRTVGSEDAARRREPNVHGSA